MTTLALTLLRTLPGWPVGEAPTAATWMWLLVGIPLALFLVFGLAAGVGGLKKNAQAAHIAHGVVPRAEVEPAAADTAALAAAETDAALSAPRRAAVESRTH